MTKQLHNPMSIPRRTPRRIRRIGCRDDPMTGAQASYLTTLSEEAGEDLPANNLSKAEVSRRIDELKTKTQPGLKAAA